MRYIDSMLKRLHSMLDTEDLTQWERGFVEGCWEKSKEARDMNRLSNKQVEKIEQIFDKYFAG